MLGTDSGQVDSAQRWEFRDGMEVMADDGPSWRPLGGHMEELLTLTVLYCTVFLHGMGFSLDDMNESRWFLACQHHFYYVFFSILTGSYLTFAASSPSVLERCCGCWLSGLHKVVWVAQQSSACGRTALTLGQRLHYCGPIAFLPFRACSPCLPVPQTGELWSCLLFLLTAPWP